MRKVKWGILGLGNIAHKFCHDLILEKGSVLEAVASSSIERAKSFAEQYRAKKYYKDYDELFRDSEIEIIYIASLHPDHYRQSIEVMKSGKAVLCEKPIAMNQNQVQSMIKVSAMQKVFLMEGLWTRFNPNLKRALQLCKDGEIGEITYINASFNFNGMAREGDSRIFDIQKGGGALLDIGIYPIFLSYLFLGFPIRILASSIKSEQNIDLQTSIIFQYEGAQSILHCGFKNNEQMVSRICGTKGQIQINHPWHNPSSITLFKDGNEPVEMGIKIEGKGYIYEIRECNKSLREGKTQSQNWSHQNSFELISLLDLIRSKSGLIYPDDDSNLLT